MTPAQKRRYTAVLESARKLLIYWSTNEGAGYPDPRAALPPELEPHAEHLSEYAGDEILRATFLNRQVLSGYLR